ncbi:hypothetical protein E1J03_22650 [Phocaeicola dorei]|uniref:Uncharacterized protein n=1 Tax=Bacteroides finegoldii TaxID=338188 RepID=A0A7J4YTG3_9BACE|nr:hypothetical protein F2Z28_01010 [Bacteroides finegoldii]RGS96132.1 hypothetical protein DWX66_07385 [Phocaeicola vulgatus]RJX03222.1 hypothetical protein DWW74_15675 [Bacteroides sp. AF17-1]TDB22363.1 hypothetical protein E1J03_22650 [Phocaeicola dorei]KAA5223908.1 hypothetical protein F2Z16_01010 [Bacteroides finegoldii]
MISLFANGIVTSNCSS